MLVAIVIGSKSDEEVMSVCGETLDGLSIPFEQHVMTAHRTPDVVAEFARGAAESGIEVIIAGAGGAAALPGVCAAYTTLPVIGVPIDSSALNGLDALLSTTQMPGGVSVAGMAIGKAGAKNAGILAVQILALSSKSLHQKLTKYKKDQAKEVERKSRKLKSNYGTNT